MPTFLIHDGCGRFLSRLGRGASRYLPPYLRWFPMAADVTSGDSSAIPATLPQPMERADADRVIEVASRPGTAADGRGGGVCRYRSEHPFRIWRALGSALLFGLLGPPIGGLVLGTVRPRLPCQEIT